MAAQTTPSFLKTQSFSNTANPSKASPMSVSPKSTNTKDYSLMSTSPTNNNKVYKHYTSINDLRPVEEDCTQAMILLGSDKPLQVSYPSDNENPIDVDATSDFSNLASKLTFPTQRQTGRAATDKGAVAVKREHNTDPTDSWNVRTTSGIRKVLSLLSFSSDINKRLPGPHFDPPTKDEVRVLMQECDINIDGELNREEFVKFVRKLTKDTFIIVSQGLLIALAVAPTIALLTKRSTEGVPHVGKVVQKMPNSLYASLVTLIVVMFQQAAEAKE
ncbi:hypothetical protein RND71_015696 [Anisodus tanguticus]|uniref:EF-hand domain-containing protein n=1 Tax=Anisodus tanguticus TaxID=243964 RepID=A0AAE1S7X1_9SOLA|nr:hypothetical protein RND71_015696 [Anisodus tanguticus]